MHSNRCADVIFVQDGVVKAMGVAESPDDPAGDDFPGRSLRR